MKVTSPSFNDDFKVNNSPHSVGSSRNVHFLFQSYSLCPATYSMHKIRIFSYNWSHSSETSNTGAISSKRPPSLARTREPVGSALNVGATGFIVKAAFPL